MEITVELRPVAELIPYDKNARKHSPVAITRLVKIILEMGWTNPILVDVAIKRWSDFTGKEATLVSSGATFGEVASLREAA